MTNATLAALSIPSIEVFFRSRDWKRDVNPLGEIEFTSPDSEWQVQVSPDGWWSIGKFTDGDLPNDAYKGGFEAVGRYESQEEGQTLNALEDELVSLGAVAWSCPWCGEEGGESITEYSREWQGDAYHGGMVEWADERCTKCIRRR